MTRDKIAGEKNSLTRLDTVKKYILSLAVGVSALLLVLAVIIAITLNSGTLDLMVKNRLVESFDRELKGRLSIEEVDLQFPSQVILHQPELYRQHIDTPDIFAEKITLNLNFLRLLSNFSSITIRSLKVDSLTLHLERYPDGKTNIEEIFAPSEVKDSGTSGFDSFLCDRIQINAGSLEYINHPKPEAEPEHLSITGIQFQGRKFRYSSQNISGVIRNLLFQVPQHGFTLREGTAKLSFTGKRFEILDLKAKTDKSSAELSIGIYDFNIFSLEDSERFSNSPAMFTVKEANIHTDDLNLLLPEQPLPSGIYRISGNAEGVLRKMDVSNTVIAHKETVLHLNGELLNLNQPDFLGFRLETDSSKISEDFLQAATMDTTLKKLLKPAGDIEFSGYGQGNMKNLYGSLSIRTETGNIELSLETELENNAEALYKGEFSLENFELHRFLLDDTTAVSGINCTGSFSGKGISPRPLEASLSINLLNSLWQQQKLADGNIELSYSGNVLSSNWKLAGDGSEASFSGTIDWTKTAPVYAGNGSVSNIDVSKIFGSGAVRSNLNLSLLFRGEHFDLEKLNGNLSALFSLSTINGYELKNGSELSLHIVQKSPVSSVALKSDFLDFSAEGHYTFREFLSGIRLTAVSAAREAAKNNIWDRFSHSALPADNIDRDFSAQYSLTVRNISPLALFLPVKGYELTAKASGKSYRSNGSLHLTSSITIGRLNSGKDFSMRNANLEVEATYNKEGFNQASLDGNALSLQTVQRNIEGASLKMVYGNSRLDASLNLTIPEIRQSLAANITALRSNELYELSVNDLTITGPDGTWAVNRGARIDVGRNYTRIHGLKLGKEKQAITCKGLLSNELAGLFECSIQDLYLKELEIFLPGTVLEGTISSSLRVSGAPGAKTASMNLAGRDLVYDDVVIGTLNLDASHKGERLRASLTTGRLLPEPLNDIRATASIPLRINWSPPRYFIPDNQPISVSCSSEHLSAGVLELLLPFFDTAEGTIPAKLTVSGTTPDPDISFSTTLKDTEITVTPTETVYRLSGSLAITPEKADFRNIVIKDDRGGTGRISGSAGIQNLEATTIDLTASFENLLLFNKQDKKDESSFGTIIGTSNRVRFYGDTTQPVLTGNLLITDADFTLYRTGSNESAKYVGAERFIEFSPRYPQPADTTRSEEVVQPENPEFYYTLIDIVQIQNLRLKSAAPLNYNMIFDRTRGEQLETTLQNLSLDINKRQQSYRLFGSVDISSGKYRFSNTNFDLDNGGRIVWNNVDIRSGVMENLFGRKYVNASNAETGESDNVRLLLAIQGTLNTPDVQMGYYLNDDSQPYSSENMIGNQNSKIDPNAEPNVVSLLLTKQWYIRPGSRGGFGNVPFSSVGLSAGTGLLSSQISQFVEKAAGFESFSVNVGLDEQGSLSGLEFSLAFLVPETGGKVRFIGTGSSPDIRKTALFDYYGNSQQLEYRINPKLFFEAYRSYGLFGNDVTTTNLLEPKETFGVSLSYRERFYSWEQFWNRAFGNGKDK